MASDPEDEIQPGEEEPSKPEFRKPPGSIRPRSDPSRALRQKESAAEEERQPEPEVERERRTSRSRSVAGVRADEKTSRAVQMQHVAIILAVVFFTGAMFYLGTKFPFLVYKIRTYRQAKAEKALPDPYPNVSPEELVQQGLVAQNAGRWQEAADRFISAKRKNHDLRGIFFRVGALLAENGDLINADKFLARSIEFGEDVDAANSYRAEIAARDQNLATAESFAETAAAAAPFNWIYYYRWAEILRQNGRPKDAIRRYEQGALCAKESLNDWVCRFKIRLARIEARDPEIAGEIAQKLSEESPAGDWLITSAALKVQEGHFGDAVALLEKARAISTSSVFGFGISDMIFRNAAMRDPTLLDLSENATPPLTPFH
jgi:hypothetical protein